MWNVCAVGAHPAYWRCKPCGIAYRQHIVRTSPAEANSPNPRCIGCRRPMHSSRNIWGCKRCGAYCTAQTSRAIVKRTRDREGIERRPWCVECRGVMRLHSQGCFRCHPCRISVKARPTRPPCSDVQRRLRRPETAAALLCKIAAALPAYLAPDEREDAAQSIMLDMLAGKLPPVTPTPHTLRRYAAAARGMVSNRFRFISLSEPTRDGREFGDTLAA